MVNRRVSLLCAAFAAVTGCFLFDDPHEPCSSLEGTGVPVPGPTPGQDPVPTGPLSDDANGASGDRYRRASNGLICRCGDNEIGCYDSPDEALKASVCRPSPLGPEYEANCQPEGTTPPSTHVPQARFTCDYELIDRKTKEREPLTRTQSAESLTRAEVLHIKWCDEQTRTSPDYVFSAGGCR
jgi:hypothetical protein